MDKNKEGMYCSRQFADWMLLRNKQDLDYPALSYQKLIRLFCRPNYEEFFMEEERKGNQFVYDIVEVGDKIKLKSSYEIVYLPYEGVIEYDLPEEVDSFIPGYRILQTRGCMPGSTEAAFEFGNYYTMKYVVDEIALRAEHIEKFAKEKKPDSGLRDVYNSSEFQEAEMKDFIDNEWPFSAGPECPDKLICRQMYTRIIIHLMKQTGRMGFAGDKEAGRYELRVAAYVAAILTFAWNKSFDVTKGIDKNELFQKSKALYANYCKSSDTDLDNICHTIRLGLSRDVNVVIDRTAGAYSDYDYKDNKEAPIGLTAEDYERFNSLDCIDCSDEEDFFEDFPSDSENG